MLRQPRPLNPFAFERRVFSLGLPTTNLLQLYDPSRDVYSDTGLTTPAADGNAVAGWKDQSSSGYHVTQGTSGNRPTYRAAASALANRPALEFVSANSQHLDRTAASLLANLNTYTIYIAFSTTGTGEINAYSGGRSSSATPRINARVSSSGGGANFLHRSDANVSAAPQAPSASNDGSVHLYVLRRISSASFSLRLDGTEVATDTSAPGTTTTDGISIGARYSNGSFTAFMSGLIGVIATYSDDNYATVEPILKSYYGIA